MATDLGQILIYVIVVAAIIGIGYIILRQMNVQVPSWARQIFWILVVVVVGIFSIRFLLRFV